VRIELYGKSNSIVCLPFKTTTETAFAGEDGSSSSNSPQGRERGYLKAREQYNVSSAAWSGNTNAVAFGDNYAERFAIDSGYASPSQKAVDTLSDFHHMNLSSQMNPNVSRAKYSPTEMSYHNPLTLARRMAQIQQEFTSHGDATSKLEEQTGYNKNHTLNRSSENNDQQIAKRRSRIIQRMKTQQHHSLNNDNDRKLDQSKTSNDTKNQWRKLRRDARTRGKAIKQSNPSLAGEIKNTPSEDDSRHHLVTTTHAESDYHNRTDPEKDDEVDNTETINKPQYPREDDAKVESLEEARLAEQNLTQYNSSTLPVGEQPHEESEEERGMIPIENSQDARGHGLRVKAPEKAMLAEQSLMQQNSSASPPVKTKMKLHPVNRVGEKDRAIALKAKEPFPAQNGEASPSFKSLMSKWKSIEDNHRRT
jgi:hypothetical protein